MSYLFEMLITAALSISFYTLLASGFTLVLGVAGIFNLAHGAYALLGAYTVFAISQYLNLPVVISYPAAILGGVLLSVLTYKILIRKIQHDHVAIFMVTLIAALCIEQIIVLVFSGSTRTIDPLIDGSLTLLNVWISYNMLLIMVVAWSAIGALSWFIQKTFLGRGIIALSQDRKGAILAGVNPEKAYVVTFIIAGGLAALAGTLYGSDTMIHPHMWAFPLTISFVIVILGGIGSILGSVIAAAIIGFSETLVIYLFDPVYKEIVGLLIVMIVMLVRPQGILGREELH